jgi:hypothetical protein
MANCSVCNTPNVGEQRGTNGNDIFVRFDCPRCGVFVVTDVVADSALERAFLEVPLRRSLMSHTLRRMQTPDRATRSHLIRSADLPTFWREARLPTPLEQANNLILWIGDNQAAPAAWAETTVPAIAATIGLALAPGGNDSGALGWLQSQLDKEGLFRVQSGSGNRWVVMLEMEGWRRYEKLKEQRIESRTAFMALKFNEPVLERVVDECVRPALDRTAFKLRILTETQPAGLIDNQLRAALLAARFIISDLTHGSFGAYWEAGFGEGRGIPVIYMCEKGRWTVNKTHFDTNHMGTIVWEEDNLTKAQDNLVAMIRATLRAEAKQADD